MRKLIPLATTIAIAGAPTAGAATSTGATKARSKKITCHFTLYNPTPSSLSGSNIGFITCSRPFGDGVISVTYKATATSTPGTFNVKGTWTKWFLTGTAHGRYSGTIKFTNANDSTSKETDTWTGGTGSYKGVAGKASGTCSSTNASTETCQSVNHVTGL